MIQNDLQNRSRGYLFGQNGSKKLRPRTTGSVLEPTFFEHQNFDDILEPFSPILLSFGSKLAHFGRLLASFLKLLAPFCMHFLHVATFWLQPEEPKQSKLAPSALTHSLARSPPPSRTSAVAETRLCRAQDIKMTLWVAL